MFLDKRNNYFTIMMFIIALPVKLSCRLEFNISLMDVMERIQENKSEFISHFILHLGISL